MADEKLSLLAEFLIRPGMEEKVKKEVMALVAPTRSEPGCINYDLHQDRENPRRLVLYENWRSKKDLDEHLAMPYLQAFIAKQDELLEEPIKLTFMDMVSEPDK